VQEQASSPAAALERPSKGRHHGGSSSSSLQMKASRMLFFAKVLRYASEDDVRNLFSVYGTVCAAHAPCAMHA